MAQKRRGKMTRKQRQRQLHRRMFLTGVLVVLICVGIYSGIRRVAKTAPAMSDAKCKNENILKSRRWQRYEYGK